MNARHQIDNDLFVLQIWKTRHAILELGGGERFLNSDEAGCHKEMSFRMKDLFLVYYRGM